MLDILFIDVGVQASVEVFELREIPPPFLRDLMAIPPQVSIYAFGSTESSKGIFVTVAVRAVSSYSLTDYLRK